MAPHWFELVAWAALAVGFASALVIGADIVLLGNRQHMAIMNLVFPLTALYLGPVAVWAYFTRGRRMSHKQMHMQHARGRADERSRAARLVVAGIALRQPLRRRLRPRRRLRRVDRLGERLDDRLDRLARPRIHPRPAACLDVRASSSSTS